MQKYEFPYFGGNPGLLLLFVLWGKTIYEILPLLCLSSPLAVLGHLLTAQLSTCLPQDPAAYLFTALRIVVSLHCCHVFS